MSPSREATKLPCRACTRNPKHTNNQDGTLHFDKEWTRVSRIAPHLVILLLLTGPTHAFRGGVNQPWWSCSWSASAASAPVGPRVIEDRVSDGNHDSRGLSVNTSSIALPLLVPCSSLHAECQRDENEANRNNARVDCFRKRDGVADGASAEQEEWCCFSDAINLTNPLLQSDGQSSTLVARGGSVTESTSLIQDEQGTGARRTVMAHHSSHNDAFAPSYPAFGANNIVRTNKHGGWSLLYSSSNLPGPSSIRPPKELLITHGKKEPAETISPPSMLSCLEPLVRMCRVGNMPGSILIHVLAVHMTGRALGVHGDGEPLLSVLTRLDMIVTLGCVLLITAVSMVINDYYDARSGVDFVNEEAKVHGRNVGQAKVGGGNLIPGRTVNSVNKDYFSIPKSSKPLVSGEVPLPVIQQFVTLIYSALVVGTIYVPGCTSQLMVVGAALLTFFYTDYIKPHTVWKNAACAALIASSPLTSAAASIYPSDPMVTWEVTGRLMGSIFAFFMCREIVMDLADYTGDRTQGIQTIPVRYGKQFASGAALAFALLFVVISAGVPLLDVVGETFAFQGVDGADILPHALPPLVRLALSGAGGLHMLQKMWDVVRTGGADVESCERLVEDSKLTFALMLASFV